MEDKDASVVIAAINALSNYNDKRIKDALIDLLDDKRLIMTSTYDGYGLSSQTEFWIKDKALEALIKITKQNFFYNKDDWEKWNKQNSN